MFGPMGIGTRGTHRYPWSPATQGYPGRATAPPPCSTHEGIVHDCPLPPLAESPKNEQLVVGDCPSKVLCKPILPIISPLLPNLWSVIAFQNYLSLTIFILEDQALDQAATPFDSFGQTALRQILPSRRVSSAAPAS